jgi:hypothetical protein
LDVGASYYKTLLSATIDNTQFNNEPINDTTSKEPVQELLTENIAQEPTSAFSEAKTANNIADFRKYQLLSQTN